MEGFVSYTCENVMRNTRYNETVNEGSCHDLFGLRNSHIPCQSCLVATYREAATDIKATDWTKRLCQLGAKAGPAKVWGQRLNDWLRDIPIEKLVVRLQDPCADFVGDCMTRALMGRMP